MNSVNSCVITVCFAAFFIFQQSHVEGIKKVEKAVDDVMGFYLNTTTVANKYSMKISQLVTGISKKIYAASDSLGEQMYVAKSDLISASLKLSKKGVEQSRCVNKYSLPNAIKTMELNSIKTFSCFKTEVDKSANFELSATVRMINYRTHLIQAGRAVNKCDSGNDNLSKTCVDIINNESRQLYDILIKELNLVLKNTEDYSKQLGNTIEKCLKPFSQSLEDINKKRRQINSNCS